METLFAAFLDRLKDFVNERIVIHLKKYELVKIEELEVQIEVLKGKVEELENYIFNKGTHK